MQEEIQAARQLLKDAAEAVESNPSTAKDLVKQAANQLHVILGLAKILGPDVPVEPPTVTKG